MIAHSIALEPPFAFNIMLEVDQNYLRKTHPTKYNLRDIIKPINDVTYLICLQYEQDEAQIDTNEAFDYLIGCSILETEEQKAIDKELITLIENLPPTAPYYNEMVVKNNAAYLVENCNKIYIV